VQRANKLQILIGVGALLIGSLVYLVDRAPEQTYFVYSTGVNISLHNILPDLLGPLSNFLPSFIHVFAFALITAGVVSCGKRGWLIICFSWFLMDAAFEFGQKFSAWTLKLIPGSFEGIPILEITKGFFLRGTFDVYDLVAMAIGAAAAYVVLSVTMRRRYALS
jgi:hypothetical protein